MKNDPFEKKFIFGEIYCISFIDHLTFLALFVNELF